MCILSRKIKPIFPGQYLKMLLQPLNLLSKRKNHQFFLGQFNYSLDNKGVNANFAYCVGLCPGSCRQINTIRYANQ